MVVQGRARTVTVPPVREGPRVFGVVLEGGTLTSSAAGAAGSQYDPRGGVPVAWVVLEGGTLTSSAGSCGCS